MLSDWLWLWRSIEEFYRKREQEELEREQLAEELQRFDEASDCRAGPDRRFYFEKRR